MIASSVSGTLSRPVEDLTRDVMYAARSLRRNVVVTIATVVILAVGLGANATIFRFVSALLLQPPPVARPAELLEIWNMNAAARSAFEGAVAATGSTFDSGDGPSAAAAAARMLRVLQ